MAMISCPECGKEVSDTAFDCPSCAAPLRKPQRSFFGKIFKWSFILFNILMIAWMIFGIQGSSEVYNSASNEFEQAGAAIGTGIGVALLLGIWVVGDIILGLFMLFTRPSK